jgi:hypothetical protein
MLGTPPPSSQIEEVVDRVILPAAGFLPLDQNRPGPAICRRTDVVRRVNGRSHQHGPKSPTFDSSGMT